MRSGRGLSFRAIIVAPIVIALAVQALVCYFVIIRSDSLTILEEDTYSLFSERVNSRAGYLENDMVLRWSETGETVQKLADTTKAVLDEYGATAADIQTASPLALEIIDRAFDDMIAFVQRSEADGVYFVLTDGSGEDGTRGGQAPHSALYLLDSNPDVSLDNGSDLLLAACPIGLAKRTDIALASSWEAAFTLSGDESANAFYRKPFEAALDYPDAAAEDLGYWGLPDDIGDTGNRSITYSIPVKDDEGNVYGVFGIEINVNRVASYFPYRDLDASGQGSYLLAVADSGEEGVLSGSSDAVETSAALDVVASTGATQNLYVEGDRLSVSLDGRGYLVVESDESIGQVEGIADASALKLYDSTSPFASQQWYLLGLVPENTLFRASEVLESNLFAILGTSFGAGILLAVATAWFSSSRLRRLMNEVRGVGERPGAKSEASFDFQKTGVHEIDELADSIGTLATGLAAAGQRLSRIMALSDHAVGAFEYSWKTGAITYTDRFFETLGALDFPYVPDGVDRQQMRDGTLGAQGFDKLMKAYLPFSEPDSGAAHIIALPHRDRYLRFDVTEDADEGSSVGIVEDVTYEIRTRRRIEHERDHDILTGLLNRRAFEQEMMRIFATGELRFAAMGMLDLDNLKFMNDSFGHDWGDQYIQAAGAALLSVMREDDLCSRVSGDEFLVFIRSCADEQEAAERFDELKNRLGQTMIEAPDGRMLKVRGSIGVALYPRDALEYDELRDYADFAMYTAKHYRKGELCFFDKNRYDVQSSMLEKREDLNKLLDEMLVDYHFQPIVDARTGEVFAYEALMRPQMHSLESPSMVIDLARMQSKLYRIEQITFSRSLALFEERDPGSGAKLFVNSIGTQSLSTEDERDLERRFGALLDRLVIEITESDFGRELFGYKESLARRWNACLAIDDFGSGYNGDTTLLELEAAYVKIDMAIVRGIDTDVDRQDILKSLLSYAHDRGVQVIAEGVETEAELATVIGFGVDYIQGYLVGKPAPYPGGGDEALRETIRRMSGL
ncbi:EAL domain-containing protein [Raoultibacter phocaeensis]|uniref:EAL domain-containing protein n=1 Tax=Raoultibacter phocaeensis TaxID=2479841 RepID=UPI001118D87B|nr:EAL domain-containing protein [Raoultibacter phocaeensis]